MRMLPLLGWDIEQLLAATGRRVLIAQVEARLDRLPPQGRGRWTQFLQGR